ncbi:MAG TPA: flagellar basal body P-ring formation chaperone FlgA [Nitrospiraceae bacterium]|nr:flagellar basal body P-ring formation chaperone FlgA [Nitrospiraceae bacterium]
MRQPSVKAVAVLVGVLIGTEMVWAGVQQASARDASHKSVSRARTQEVTLDRMQAMVRDYLDHRRDAKVAEIQVTILDPMESVIVPAGALEGRVSSNSPDTGYGRRGFDLALFIQGKHIDTLKVVADVAAIGDVVTATRMIKPDETIAAEDLTVSRVKLTGASQDFIAKLDHAIGKRAIKPIRPDAPILFSMLAQPYAVRRGDHVTIEARRGGLVIQAAGVTKAAAFMGQSLTVTNQDSGKDIRAKVIAPGVVQVDF